MISKQGRKWVLRARSTGKVLGTHGSHEDAVAQEAAIQRRKKFAGTVKVAAARQKQKGRRRR